jgi:RNA polymerase sigma-70 factor (ECF subfamily)
MPASEPDDVALLRAIAEGDDVAFGLFYRRHLDAVVAFFRRRVDRPDLAFDLAAETFAAVITSAESFRDEGLAAGWLYGIARHKLADSIRRQKIEDRARRELDLPALTLTDEDLERVEVRAAAGAMDLERALDLLSPEIRAAVVARVVDEREYREIAARMQCSEQVVRQRVHRGLTRLRAGLGEQR